MAVRPAEVRATTSVNASSESSPQPASQAPPDLHTISARRFFSPSLRVSGFQGTHAAPRASVQRIWGEGALNLQRRERLAPCIVYLYLLRNTFTLPAARVSDSKKHCAQALLCVGDANPCPLFKRPSLLSSACASSVAPACGHPSLQQQPLRAWPSAFAPGR